MPPKSNCSTNEWVELFGEHGFVVARLGDWLRRAVVDLVQMSQYSIISNCTSGSVERDKRPRVSIVMMLLGNNVASSLSPDGTQGWEGKELGTA